MSTYMSMKTAQVLIAKFLPLTSNMSTKALGMIKPLACSLKNCREGITAKGVLETLAEVEQRLIAKKDELLEAPCQKTCWKNKYLHRVMVLDHLVKHKANKNEEDLPAWQWLQQLVVTLGEDHRYAKASHVAVCQ
ncbi:hypothetical protein BDR04DRAFT_1123400 [Suillus decipiens]|nr:hypothetical protein BDR04DRAFT_1123400 [Suillus decipiens]